MKTHDYYHIIADPLFFTSPRCAGDEIQLSHGFLFLYHRRQRDEER